MPLVPALLRPAPENVPVAAQSWIAARFVLEPSVKPSDAHQIPEIMCVARVDPFLIWKFMAVSSFSDAGLQSTLDRIPGEVKRSIKQTGFQ